MRPIITLTSYILYCTVLLYCCTALHCTDLVSIRPVPGPVHIERVPGVGALPPAARHRRGGRLVIRSLSLLSSIIIIIIIYYYYYHLVGGHVKVHTVVAIPAHSLPPAVRKLGTREIGDGRLEDLLFVMP